RLGQRSQRLDQRGQQLFFDNGSNRRPAVFEQAAISSPAARRVGPLRRLERTVWRFLVHRCRICRYTISDSSLNPVTPHTKSAKRPARGPASDRSDGPRVPGWLTAVQI